MTTKVYKWFSGGTTLEWHDVKDECLRLTGVEAEDEADAVATLDRHFGHPHKVGYDEGYCYEGDEDE